MVRKAANILFDIIYGCVWANKEYGAFLDTFSANSYGCALKRPRHTSQMDFSATIFVINNHFLKVFLIFNSSIHHKRGENRHLHGCGRIHVELFFLVKSGLRVKIFYVVHFTHQLFLEKGRLCRFLKKILAPPSFENLSKEPFLRRRTMRPLPSTYHR